MARRVVTTVVCDLAHDDERDHPASETLRFGVDGRWYDVDLCAGHAEDARDELAALVATARPAGRGR